jgi:hypothetical protein
MSISSVPAELLPYLTGALHDDSSLQASILGVNIAFIVLVGLTTALRIYVRCIMLRAAGLDDSM